jgi:Fe-S cluster biogenesis protein NfuA
MNDETRESPPHAQHVVRRVLSEVLGPLVDADEGELYLVHLDAERVALHLGGRFSGCPGNTLATRRVIEPLIRAAAPAMDVSVSAGVLIPAGAERL